ncbi:hypothetical protein A9Q86_13150 [Flavobacteriales bacterium 33_180_T64]|nr:hypothetical protein A9Q86_13150 [Flavobacteriales bacterium 33_180_T64]
MKKLILLAAIAVFGLTNVSAQNFSAGVNVGLPIGDAGDLYSFNVGLDVNALWEVSDDFQAGIASGYSHLFGDEINGFDVDDFQYVPLAGAVRFNISDVFQIGTDVGYAIAVSDGDGGFYYRPMIGYDVAENTQINVSLRSISEEEEGSLFSVTVGVDIGF